MKKRLVLILIITILISMIIPNFIYANEIVNEINEHITLEEVEEHEEEAGKKATEQVMTEGTADVEATNAPTRTEKLGETRTSSNNVASKLCGFLVSLPKTVNSLITLIIDYVEPKNSEYEGKFTVENLVFNKYKLFDIDFFDYKENSSNINEVLKSNIAKWYYAIRNMAIVGQLGILIYVGIRIAISSLAEDKAKYKKMFVSWLKGFVLIFIMHYIVIGCMVIQNWLLNAIADIVTEQGFESTLINKIDEQFASSRGWSAVSVTIQYYIIVFYQVTFVLIYFKRFLKVGFLCVIAPLVTLTYSIDAFGTGEAKAYKTWLREIVFSIFIQSIHAIAYAVIILSAAEIAKEVPIIGALLLLFLSRTEKIIKTTLKMGGPGISDEKLLDKIKKFRRR